MPAEDANTPFEWKNFFPPEKSATNPCFDHLGTLPGQAQRLQNFVLQNFKEGTNPSLTIGLEAPWGYGKTNFLNGWVAGMRHQGHVVIHFNAWESSFASDPLQAFLAHTLRQAEPKFPANALKGLKAYSKAILRSQLIKKLAFGVINQAVKRTTGVEGFSYLTEAFINDVKSNLSSVTGKEHLSTFIAEEIRHIAMQGMLHTLSNLMQQTPKFNGKPLIFVIDELDRCPPAYALQLLERIQHVMAVNQTVFILGYDREQLEDFIGHTQGTRDIARRGDYLTRFIQRRWPLHKPEASKILERIFIEFQIPTLLPKIYYDSHAILQKNLKDFATSIFNELNTSIREQRQIFENYAYVLTDYAQRPKNNPNLQDLFTPWLALIGLLLRHYAKHTLGPNQPTNEEITANLSLRSLLSLQDKGHTVDKIKNIMPNSGILYHIWSNFKRTTVISNQPTTKSTGLNLAFHQQIDSLIKRGEVQPNAAWISFLRPNNTSTDFVINNYPLSLSAIDDLIDGVVSPPAN